MKQLILLLAVLSLNTANAQWKKDRRLRVRTHANAGIVLGDFSIRSGKQTEIGPVRNGYGGGATVGIPLYRNVIVSFHFRYMSYGVDKAAIMNIYKQRYDDPTFINEVKGDPKFEMGCPALELSYQWKKKWFELEPYIRLGHGVPQVHSNIEINRKKINDHYTERIKIITDSWEFFLPTVGTHFTVPIFDFFNASLSAGYGWGNADLKMKEEKVDFWGTTEERNYTIPTKISEIQIQAGLQLRFGKRPSKQNKEKKAD